MANVMQYGAESFNFRRQALFIYDNAFDFTRETSVKKFLISGAEPTDTSRRIIFELDDKLYYFTNDGLTQYPSYGELADILEYGNTVGELLQVDGIPEFVGKRVGIRVAMDAPADNKVMPMIKLGAVVSTYNDIYEYEELSPVLELKTSTYAKIISASTEKNLNGYADLKTFMRVRADDWSDWMTLDEAANKRANAVQFKALHTLTAIDGSESSALTNASVSYTTDYEKLAGDTLELITQPISYPYNLGTVYALIKHSELIDCELKAYAVFKEAVNRREDMIIGTGNGELKTYYLGTGGGADPYINHNSLVIKVDGKNFADFYYNTVNGTVDLQAAEGSSISASYEYGITKEIWLPMTLAETTREDSVYSSRFIRRDCAGIISAVRFSLTRKSGEVEEFKLATSNGKTQTFILEHRAKAESIVLRNGEWDYDESTQKLEVTGNVGNDIFLSYSWCGEFAKVFETICGWQAKI